MESSKVSGTEVLQRLDSLNNSLKELNVRANQALRPENLYLYKPKADGNGVAAKFDLRVSFNLSAQGFVDRKSLEGGLWLELAAQTAKGDDGFARFGWKEASLISAKLGVPDITQILVVLEAQRFRNALPEGKPYTETGVELFHKVGTSSTVITLALDKQGAFISISKSKEQRRAIRLTKAEMIAVEEYLRLGLRGMLLAGL